MRACSIRRGLIYHQRLLKGREASANNSFVNNINIFRQTRNMANRYDDLERKFGISAYASPHEGFAAVLKARYSDFLVHEGV